jgi:hypothetical protein
MLIWLKKSTVLTYANISLRYCKTSRRYTTQHKGKKQQDSAGALRTGRILTASHSSRSSFAGSTTQLRTHQERLSDFGIIETCEDRQHPGSPFVRTWRTCSCSKRTTAKKVMRRGAEEQTLCRRDAQFVNF